VIGSIVNAAIQNREAIAMNPARIPLKIAVVVSIVSFLSPMALSSRSDRLRMKSMIAPGITVAKVKRRARLKMILRSILKSVNRK